jgi:pimeloyl-ACP methyl ester carboxylesterase
MGALVALDWARRAPESIAGLVLCGASAAFGVREEAIAHMREVTLGRAARPFDPKRLAPGGSPDLMRRAWFESIQTDPRVTLVDLEASRAFAASIEPTLSAAPAPSTASTMPTASTASRDTRAIPTLVACGEQEPAAEIEAARTLASRLGARFAAISSAAHWLPLEQPAALAREILGLSEAA